MVELRLLISVQRALRVAGENLSPPTIMLGGLKVVEGNINIVLFSCSNMGIFEQEVVSQVIGSNRSAMSQSGNKINTYGRRPETRGMSGNDVIAGKNDPTALCDRDGRTKPPAIMSPQTHRETALRAVSFGNFLTKICMKIQKSLLLT